MRLDFRDMLEGYVSVDHRLQARGCQTFTIDRGTAASAVVQARYHEYLGYDGDTTEEEEKTNMRGRIVSGDRREQ